MTGKRSKPFQLQQLRNPACNYCELHKSTVNVCVMGRGNVSALIHLVGEAPGEAEAKTGKPFMGAAGKLLDELLREANIENDVYISNTCRCRPPDNRKPTGSEMVTCKQNYLEPEIKIIGSKVVVCMGRTATNALMGLTTRVGDIDFHDYPVPISTYHPAYALPGRGGSVARKVILGHLKRAREIAYE